MPNAIVLFSGGLDSTTCLAYAKSLGYDCHALTFDYGQRHEGEIKAAEKIARHFQAKSHRVFTFPIGQFGGSALTDPTIAVPDFKGGAEIPLTYVPARNTIFLSVALGFAEVMNAEAIFVGVSATDYSGYPDCRPEFIQAFQNLANVATKAAVEGNPVKIIAPVIHLTKAETIKLGLSLGVDYAMTVSCYRATPEGLACGSCDSCHYRKKGFEKANIKDPTRYQVECD
jgi:7-cyano-7-deazaguanine synthase